MQRGHFFNQGGPATYPRKCTCNACNGAPVGKTTWHNHAAARAALASRSRSPSPASGYSPPVHDPAPPNISEDPPSTSRSNSPDPIRAMFEADRLQDPIGVPDGHSAGPTVLEAMIVLLDTVVTYKQNASAAAGTWHAVDALLPGTANLPAYKEAKAIIRKYSMLTCVRYQVCTLFALFVVLCSLTPRKCKHQKCYGRFEPGPLPGMCTF
jgi:hypothetical protein